MSLRSLLFSSDQETSRVVGQVLRAMGLEVEHCPEIFAAVEKLTTRHFEIILTDFDDGVEAQFLLKTSRELASHHDSLVIALTSVGVNASQPKVDVVLHKPLTADKLRSTLLKDDAFLGAMKKTRATPPASLPKPLNAFDPKQFDAKPTEDPLLETAPIIPLAETATRTFQHETTTVYPSTMLSTRNAEKAEPYIEARQPRLRSKRKPTRNEIVRQSVLGAFFLGLAYVGVQPARSEAIVSTVAVVYQKAVDSTSHWLHSSRPVRADDAEDLDATDIAPMVQPSPIETIYVAQPAAPVTPEAIAAAIPSVGNMPPKLAPQAIISPGLMIPESIKSSYDGSGLRAAAEAPVRASSSVLGSVEPVALPEDISQKMVLDRVQPSYPKQAIQAGLQGPVVLQAWISREGNVQDLKLIRGYLVLGEAASDAVRKWRFRPYLLNGHAVSAQTLVTIDFHLPQMGSVSGPILNAPNPQ